MVVFVCLHFLCGRETNLNQLLKVTWPFLFPFKQKCMDFGLDLFDQWLSNVSWIILHVSINMGGNMDTLYIYFRRTSWQVGDTPKPKILIEIHVGGGGWVKFKVNLQIWSRTNIFTHSEENTFICKLYKYSSTPAICFNEPMFVQEKSDYCKKCNLSFIPSLHFTSHMLVHSGGKPSQVPRPTLHS